MITATVREVCDMEEFIGILAAKAAAASPVRDGDYEQDGLLYCGHCGTPKQCRISFGAEIQVFPCQCACAERRYLSERQAEESRQQRMRIDNLRADGVRDKSLAACRFDGAEETPELEKCRRYAENWETAKAQGIGLLLWGSTGNGKTYAAACIANSLIDRGVPAMITSFPRIIGAKFEDRPQIMEAIRRYPLLVLDDLGVERATDFALETVYSVVDERYKTSMPLIVTTNLTLAEMKEAQSMSQQRIYERILEMCTPIAFRGKSRRLAIAEERKEIARQILEEPHCLKK